MTLEPILLTIPQAMNRLNLGRSKVYQLLAHGDLVGVRIGRAVRIQVSVIDAYVAKIQAEADAEASTPGTSLPLIAAAVSRKEAGK